MQKCPVCGKFPTREKGVQFPSDSAKFIRYCLQLKLNPKHTNKKDIICYEHFDPKDLIKEGDKVIGISRMALPRPSRLTLDQLLEKNVGMSASAAAVSSQPSASASSSARQFSSTATTSSSHVPNGCAVLGSLHNRHCSVIQNVTTNCQEQMIHGQNVSTNVSQQPLTLTTTQMADAAKKTLVLFRNAADSFGDQKSVTDWLRLSFSLPADAILHISSPLVVKNSQIIFIVFDDIRTAKNIMEMFKFVQNSQQCLLCSASEVLNDGAECLKRKIGSAALPPPSSSSSPVCRRSDVTDTLRVILQPNSPSTFVVPAFSDENAWRNLAAAMVPAYNNLVAAASSPLQHQTLHSDLAAAAAALRSNSIAEGNSSATEQTSIEWAMSQIDAIIRQQGTTD